MGKHKYIKTPEALWELFVAYKTEIKDNPRITYDYVGKDGTRVPREFERPLTIEGSYTYCHENASTVEHYFKNSENSYEDYRPIITRVRNAIRQDQIEGGMTGHYNSNLTARINGLREQTETITHNVKLMNLDVLQEPEETKKITTKKKLK